MINTTALCRDNHVLEPCICSFQAVPNSPCLSAVLPPIPLRELYMHTYWFQKAGIVL